MSDTTETARRQLTQQVNAAAAERAALEARHGQVWNTKELQQEFTVTGFAAPFVIVTRKSDGVTGSLMFQHDPRYYFAWQPR